MSENKKAFASRVVGAMYANDNFSQWLGIERLEEGPGTCTLRMKIRPDMTNGFDIAHGGITFSFADSAFAFASNSHGRKSVSVETSISHMKSLKVGDVITARAIQQSISHKIGVWIVEVTDQDHDLVAHFKGTVYRTSKEWLV